MNKEQVISIMAASIYAAYLVHPQMIGTNEERRAKAIDEAQKLYYETFQKKA